MKKLKRLDDFEGVDYSSAKKETAEEVMKKYERHMKEKTVLEMMFPMETSRKNKLYRLDGGVPIYLSLKKTETKEVPLTPVRSAAHKGIGKKVDVIVEKVDFDSQTVTVKEVAREAGKRAEVIQALKSGIGEREFIRVPATVIGFTGVDRATGAKDDSVILLDIADLGIAGAIVRKDWTTTGIKNLRHSVKVGDVEEVAVTGICKWTSGQLFECSRRAVMEADGIDPWEGIEQRFPKRTQVVISPIELREKCFFAVTENLRDIEILGYYPDREGTGLDGISLGEKYIGCIAKVSESERKLCVRVLGKFDG